MIKETKEKLIERLKMRFEGITDKFNVHSYKGELSNENASLILFSEFLKNAHEGIDFVLRNAFDESKQYRIHTPIIKIISHIYSSSLLYYAKMFRGGNGIKREKLMLKENKLFDSEGNVKILKNNEPSLPKNDRFYIEEFFEHNSEEFKFHHKILFQVDKTLVHIDETELTRCYTLLLFDKKETNQYLGIDNYFEYFQLPNNSELKEFLDLLNKIHIEVNQKINQNAKLIHESLMNEKEYGNYYKDLIINEDEL